MTARHSGSGFRDGGRRALCEHGHGLPGRQTSDVENDTHRHEWALRSGWARRAEPRPPHPGLFHNNPDERASFCSRWGTSM